MLLGKFDKSDLQVRPSPGCSLIFYSPLLLWVGLLVSGCSRPTAEVVPLLRPHNAWVNAIALSPDESKVLSSSEDDGFSYWDISSSKELAHVKSHKVVDIYATFDVAFTPDGNFAVSGGLDKAVELWSLKTFASERRLYGHPLAVGSVSISPQGDKILSAGGDGALMLWSRADGTLLCNLVGHKKNYGLRRAFFSEDGRTAVSASQDRSIRTWDLTTCKEVSAIKDQAYVGGPIAVASRRDLAASHAADGHSLLIWDLRTGQELKRMIRYKGDIGHDGDIYAIAFSPNQHQVVSGGQDKRLEIWDVASGKRVKEQVLPTAITSIAVSKTGNWVLAGGKDGAIYRVDLN